MRLRAIRGIAALCVCAVGRPGGNRQRRRTRYDAEAIRLNNRGVALMGQQFTDRAADEPSQQAFKKDPKLAAGRDQRGHRADDAAKAGRGQEGAADRPSPSIPAIAQAWYNLGLAQHAGNELDQALASFQQAAKIRSATTPIPVFPGRLSTGDAAVRQGHRDLSRRRWRSIRCTLRRSLCWRGRCSAPATSPRRKEHFTRFQHLTSTKISSAHRAVLRGAGPLFHGDSRSKEPETIQRSHDPSASGGSSRWCPTAAASAFSRPPAARA